jgi:predicted MFS family arabinose efflux permease
MRWAFAGLWTHPGFLKLWAASTFSQFGLQVTLVVLPLVAALTLDASPGQMGILSAARTAPFLLIGLLVGAWLDRVRRRPVLVAADMARAGLLLAIPIAWFLDALRIEVLYGAALLLGACTVISEVAYGSYLPSLVSRKQLVEGNSKLQVSASAAQIGGPGIAGALVGLLTAPLALVVDALSHLVSAMLLWRIDPPERGTVRQREQRRVLRDIAEGLRSVFGNPVLRALAACSATSTLFGFVFLAVYVLYLTDTLGLGPAAVGFVFSSGGVGALLGAALASHAARRFGLGRALVGAQVLLGVCGLAIPLAIALPSVALPLVVVSEFATWAMLMAYTVNAVSLRQAITPDHLQGRVTASARYLIVGVQPVGSLLGGALGEVVGVQATLVIGVLGMLAAFLWLLFSPVRCLR